MDITLWRELASFAGVTSWLALSVAFVVSTIVNLGIYFFQKQIDTGRDKKVAELQAQLDSTLKQLQTRLDVKSHVTRIQFDVEFNAYREIWKKLNIAYHLFANLEQWHKLEPSDSRKQKIDELSSKLMDALNDLAFKVTEDLPFYSADIATLLDNIRVLVNETTDVDPSVYPESVTWKIDSLAGERFEVIRNEIVTAIRKRLAGIAVVN